MTDVVDPNGNTFTSTKENIIVFDREFLATATKDELVERIAHEFGHYTEADNETKSQKAAEYFSGLVMEKVKGVSSKEATDETYTRIRNNKNVIIGEEGKKLAENVPMNDREYFAIGKSKNVSATFLGRVNGGRSEFIIYNLKNKNLEIARTTDFGIGGGTIGVGASESIVILKDVNTANDLNGHSFIVGGSITITPISNIGLEVLFNSKKEFMGVKIVGGIGKGAPIVVDGYATIDSSVVTSSKNLTDKKDKILEKIENNLDKISKLAETPQKVLKNVNELNRISNEIIENIEVFEKW